MPDEVHQFFLRNARFNGATVNFDMGRLTFVTMSVKEKSDLVA